MGLIVVLGMQWGDEGKGRIVDALSEEADVVARFGGGNNAGHTIWVGDKKYVTHLIPAGIVRDKICVLGNGMVINPRKLCEEMKSFVDQGLTITPQNFMISSGAHLITPFHEYWDGVMVKGKLGTTGQGIGPAYADKAARQGLRAGQMRDPKVFREAVRQQISQLNVSSGLIYEKAGFDPDAVADEYAQLAEYLAPYVQDTGWVIHDHLLHRSTVLAEGAQGALIDIDHGTYPFVTSSSTTIGGVFTGLGVGVEHLETVVGVTKAYQTRVGNGPMPTELFGAEAARLRGVKGEPGAEYGATTGRDRRCGWLDLVLLRYAVRVNGVKYLALTKLDVLSGLSHIKICTAYERKGRVYSDLPDGADDLSQFKPVYEDIQGWDEDISQVRRLFALPAAAWFYLRRIESLTGTEIKAVSVGPERDQIFFVE